MENVKVRSWQVIWSNALVFSMGESGEGDSFKDTQWHWKERRVITVVVIVITVDQILRPNMGTLGFPI